MEDQSQTQVKQWEGKVSLDLPSINADQAWTLLSDFCSIHLWLPRAHACEKLNGLNSKPGCIRYVMSLPNESGVPDRWAKEELLSFNEVERNFSYKMIDNNIGFGEYVAVFRVLQKDANSDMGCSLEWSFECEPVKGWSQEGFVGYVTATLKDMADSVEKAIRVSSVHDEKVINGESKY